MTQNFRVVEPNSAAQAHRSPYQEVAVFIRELLKCDYALVAIPDGDSIRVQGFADADSDAGGNVGTGLLARLRGWGPVVVDDARLIAVPVSRGEQVLGILIGYSANAGTFTTEDLEKLMAYAPIASGIFISSAAEANPDIRTRFTTDELVHFFRLITIGEFSACFAHEVRNPLTLIRGHLRLLDDSLAADPPARVHVNAIDRNYRRIEDMARRMLDFSRKRDQRTEPCAVSELISDALRFAQPYVRNKFIDVQVHIDARPSMIQADRWQMIQAIVNVLQNAADAMEQVSRRVLSLKAQMGESELTIVISDTGTGIAPADMQRIFEPFFTTKGDRGTGLGLYITKQVIEEHRGTITVQTSTAGTSFTITLPL